MSANQNLKKVFGSAFNLTKATRSAAAVQAAQQNNALTSKWLNRIRDTAVNNESREQQGQLQAILDYFNRNSSGDLAPIDWENYSSNIHTAGVVDKIKDKYELFMKTEYNVEGAVGKCGVRTEAMKALDVAMHYNYNLWMAHYLMHLN